MSTLPLITQRIHMIILVAGGCNSLFIIFKLKLKYLIKSLHSDPDSDQSEQSVCTALPNVLRTANLK